MQSLENSLRKIQVPNIVVGVLVCNEKKEVLLVKSPKWKDTWVVVGGHVEYGEPLTKCAIREVKEETGLEITNLEFIQVQESIFSKEFNERRHFVFINYYAKAINNEVKLNEEMVDFLWINPKKALDMNLNTSTRNFIITFLEKCQHKDCL